MIKKAFTMLELVMVIVVLGILAALAIPRMERDLTQEAADNVLSAIRYTQHLALIDDKQNFKNNQWQRKFWRIYFGTCEDKKFYAVGSDDNMDGSTNAIVDSTEAALDPANGKIMWAHDGDSCVSGTVTQNDLSPQVFIGKKYGVDTISPSGGCSNEFVGFDHLGRPYNSGFVNSSKPNNAGLITTTCALTFGLKNGESFTINIEPETGYAYISNQTGS